MADTDTSSSRGEALREYYFALQIIDNFDNRALQIKSWSVTASGVAIGAAYIEGKPELLLLASLSALVFWFIEGMWKSFQRIAIERSEELEAQLQRERIEYKGPEWSGHYRRNFTFWKKLARFSRVFFYANTYLPHVVVAIAGGVLYTEWKGMTEVGSVLLDFLGHHLPH